MAKAGWFLAGAFVMAMMLIGDLVFGHLLGWLLHA